MKVFKRMAWVVPTVALAVGAVALSNGFAGVTTGSSLPAPVEGTAVVNTATGSTAVDGETWTAMRISGSAIGF